MDGNSLLIMDILVELEDGSLATDNIDDAELLIADYPWLAEIYEEIAEYMRKPKEVLTMFSDALKISDHNTVQYMIEEQAQQLVDKDTQLATMLLCQLFTIFYIFVHSGTHLILTGSPYIIDTYADGGPVRIQRKHIALKARQQVAAGVSRNERYPLISQIS